MQNAIPSSRIRQLAGIAAALILIGFGAAAVMKGIDGRSTVRDALTLEAVKGEEGMTPSVVAQKAKKAGLAGVQLPTCSVEGKAVDNGTDARCFAQYMRVDALLATGGRTYAQMPRFASKDGKGTDIEAAAVKLPNGVGMPNPARNVWITETALSTALNTSYMAEQISLFGIAVGGAFLLVGLAFGAVALGAVKLPARKPALARERQSAQVGQPA
jgi:F0F1-type ATP synthase membrane subunit c/vacuolar-type H+-ATPase subunit K